MEVGSSVSPSDSIRVTSELFCITLKMKKSFLALHALEQDSEVRFTCILQLTNAS